MTVMAAAQASTVSAAGCPKAASSSSGSRKADATLFAEHLNGI